LSELLRAAGNDGWAALESYRAEMVSHQQRLARLSASFYKLRDYPSAAKCAIEAAGLDFALARIPQPPNGLLPIAAKQETQK